MLEAYFDFINKKFSLSNGLVTKEDENVTLVIDQADCTSEEIISSYNQYGADCVNYLPGAFSFVLFDKKEERLLVVRDKLGVRPMYYSQLP